MKDIEVTGNEDDGVALGAQANLAGQQIHLRIVIPNGVLHAANALRFPAGDRTGPRSATAESKITRRLDVFAGSEQAACDGLS